MLLFENLKCLSPDILFCHDSSVLNSDYSTDFQKVSLLLENMQKDEIILNGQQEGKGAVKEGDITNCHIEIRLYIALVADKWHPDAFATLPALCPSSSALPEHSRTLPPVCLLTASTECSV